MALKNQYSVQLYTKDFKESNSWRSSYYVVYYGNTPQQTYLETFPEMFSSKDERMDFISMLFDTLKQKREAKNKIAKEKREAKKQQKELKLQPNIEEYLSLLEKEFEKDLEAYEEAEIEIPEVYEELLDEEDDETYYQLLEEEFAEDLNIKPRSFDISVSEKSARGAFKNADYDFRHTILAYDTPQPVNVQSKEDLNELYDSVRDDFDEVIDTAFNEKGERRWIVKLLTPFYDHEGNIMYSDVIKETDEDGNKTGKEFYAPTSYSYGFSIGRTLRMNNKQQLREELDHMLTAWSAALERYGNITSKIELAGIMLEEII